MGFKSGIIVGLMLYWSGLHYHQILAQVKRIHVNVSYQEARK